MIIYGIILLGLAAGAWWAMCVRRGLVRLRKQAVGAWEQLAAQLLARRKAVAAWFEQPRAEDYAGRSVARLDDVRQALREGPLEGDIRLLCQAEGDLNAALQTMMAPEASNGSGRLPPAERARIAACNNRIRLAAEFYNTQALIYNTRLATMSLKLPAYLGGFRPLELFTAPV